MSTTATLVLVLCITMTSVVNLGCSDMKDQRRRPQLLQMLLACLKVDQRYCKTNICCSKDCTKLFAIKLKLSPVIQRWKKDVHNGKCRIRLTPSLTHFVKSLLTLDLLELEWMVKTVKVTLCSFQTS